MGQWTGSEGLTVRIDTSQSRADCPASGGDDWSPGARDPAIKGDAPPDPGVGLARPSVDFYLRALDAGGVQLSMLHLSRMLQRQGLRIRFIIQQAGGELENRVPAGVETINLEARSTSAAVVPLARLLRRDPADILVSGLIHGNIAALMAAWLAGARTRVVVTEHAPPLSLIESHRAAFRYRLLPSLMRLLYPRAAAVVAVSEGVKRELETMLGERKAIRVIHNPVVPEHVDQLASAPEVLPAAMSPYLLAVGRLSVEKRFDLLLDAYARLASRVPHRLVILGEGEQRQALEAKIAALGLGDRVVMPGFVHNPYPFYAGASAVVVTSEFEGFCNVLAEALACGTPVVSTDCPFGPREILEDGRYGRLVAMNNAQALADGILATLEEQPDRDRLQRRADRFHISHSALAYRRLFDALVCA